MRWTVERHSVSAGTVIEDIGADSMRILDGGTLAFFTKDGHMNHLFLVYAPGQWLTAVADSEED